MEREQEGRFGLHFARLFGRLSGLTGECRSSFELLLARLVASMEEGHSCLPLTDRDLQELQANPLVSNSGDTPLVIFTGRLYLQRYYCYEKRLAARIAEMAESRFENPMLSTYLDELFDPSACDQRQRDAGILAATRQLAIISGGPGTGKTTTAARVIVLLARERMQDGPLRIALAAPTGKAAIRLQQSLQRAYDFLGMDPETQGILPQQATTIHRLLGVKRGAVSFRHNHDNPLEEDVVLIDEASMVDLALMSKLLDALKPGARLILLGDREQLASVESGAVLADMIECLPQNTVILTKTYRFDRDIEALARAVNQGQAPEVLALCEQPDKGTISMTGPLEFPILRAGYKDYFEAVRLRHTKGREELFATLDRFRILCATRVGPQGTDRINRLLEHELQRKVGCSQQWYPGRPVIITENSYGLRLFNGDVGICLEDEMGRLRVFFETESGYSSFLPSRLPAHQPSFAITIHKSQGSEFEVVALLLPEGEGRGLTRELVYTGITRARKRVVFFSSSTALREAVEKKTERRSGLSAFLKGG